MPLSAAPAFHSRVFWIQTWALTGANLKSRYRKTIAGFLWVVLNPLIMYGVQSLVFTVFLKIQLPRYAIFLVAGLLPWIFIQQTLEMCTSILVTNGRLLKSFQVNPLVYLVSQVTDNLINFLAAFGLVLVPLCLMDTGQGHLRLLILLPIPVALMALAVLGMAWLLATWQVFLRDTRFVVSFVLSISFFLTPIFYPVSYVPPELRIFAEINPFYRLIVPFQILLHDYDAERFGLSLFYAFGIASGFLGWAYLNWERKRNAVYFNV
jgi:lipopolysaccharide transport system permease protein